MRASRRRPTGKQPTPTIQMPIGPAPMPTTVGDSASAGNRHPETRRPSWRDAPRLLRGPLRRLVGGQALGQGADGMLQVAFAQFVLFEVGRGATPAEIAALLAATLLPFSLVGPFAGVVIDRWDRRRVLTIASWVRAAVAVSGVAIVVQQLEIAAYGAILVLLSLSRFVLAAKGAALPCTVTRRELVTANAVSSVAGMAAAFVGAAAAAMFVATAPVPAFAVGAVLYVGAADRFRGLPFVGGGEETPPLLAGVARVLRELADGIGAIVRDRAVGQPLLAVWGHRFLLGAGFIVLVLVADYRYGLEAPGYGLALIVTGVGAFAGTLLAPPLAHRFRPAALLPLTFIVAGAAVALAGYVLDLPALIVGLGVIAFAFQILKVLVDAQVGGATADSVRGRVFAVYDVLYNVAFVLAGLAMIPLWEPGRERMLLWFVAFGFVVGWLLLSVMARVWPFASRRLPQTPAPHRWLLRGAALLGGCLLALAFPMPSLWWLAWIGLVPVLLIVRAAPSAWEAALRAWMAGAGFMLAVHYWLFPNVLMFFVPVGFAVGLLWLPWGAIVWALLHDRPRPGRRAAALVVVPSAWVLVEVLRSWEHLGGPFGLLGASQWQIPMLLAPAALGGVWLVSFLVVAANVAIVGAVTAATARVRVWSAVAVIAALVVGPVAYALTGEPSTLRRVRVGLVQPGVVHSATDRFDTGERLTRSLRDTDVDLVVWGESSVGFDLVARPDLEERLQGLTDEVGADLLVNVDAQRDSDGIYKSTVLIGADGASGRYDKMRLVPFGEYIPLRPALGWVSHVVDAADENRRRGDNVTLLESAGLALGPLVCFESAFPDLSRRLVGEGADVLVFQSATTTFQESWAPAQHASLAAVRAAETGRPALHATTTGVTAVFDARGRELAWFDTNDHGVHLITVPVSDGLATAFVRFGDWVPCVAIVAMTVAALGAALAHGRESQPKDVTHRVPTYSLSGG